MNPIFQAIIIARYYSAHYRIKFMRAIAIWKQCPTSNKIKND